MIWQAKVPIASRTPPARRTVFVAWVEVLEGPDLISAVLVSGGAMDGVEVVDVC